MWIFIASESIFFAALMATYLIYRGKTPFEEGLGHLDLNVASANTFILLASSLTMVLSLQSIENGKRGRMILFLILTAVLGGLFLGGQAYEYYELLIHDVSIDTNLFGATFFTLTGFHGSHVAVGVLWIILLIIRALRGGVTQQNHLAVELGGLYWHFVDLVWVVLFTIIYLI
jgi:heme/copper-type cytochrome/quinol oxidase subunit 3